MRVGRSRPGPVSRYTLVVLGSGTERSRLRAGDIHPGIAAICSNCHCHSISVRRTSGSFNVAVKVTLPTGCSDDSVTIPVLVDAFDCHVYAPTGSLGSIRGHHGHRSKRCSYCYLSAPQNQATLRISTCRSSMVKSSRSAPDSDHEISLPSGSACAIGRYNISNRPVLSIIIYISPLLSIFIDHRIRLHQCRWLVHISNRHNHSQVAAERTA